MATPVYNWPTFQLSDPPNGPDQMSQLALGIEDTVSDLDDQVQAAELALDQLHSPAGALDAAPVASASQSSYPFGLSIRDATTGLGYPTNGILTTWRYVTNARVVQQLTTSSNGATAVRSYVRSWGNGPAWTPWARTDAPPESQAGVESVTFASSSTHLRTVSFATTFTVIPQYVGAIIASNASGTSGWNIRTDTYTTTSFRLILDRAGVGDVTWTGVPVRWHAVTPH